MFYGILMSLFTLLCLFLILIVLIQKGKSSMGLGSLGGGTQMLFGGSGGQDLFQKTTWIMVALFMGGSLILAMMKRPARSDLLGSLAKTQTAQMPAPQKAPDQQQPETQQ